MCGFKTLLGKILIARGSFPNCINFVGLRGMEMCHSALPVVIDHLCNIKEFVSSLLAIQLEISSQEFLGTNSVLPTSPALNFKH